LLPVRDEQIQTALFDDASRSPDELFAVWTEHRKAVELRIVGDLLEAAHIEVDEIELEVPASGALVVRREDDPPIVRGEKRPEVRAAEVRDLKLVGAVGVHDPL